MGTFDGVKFGVDVDEAIGEESIEIKSCFDEERVKKLSKSEIFSCYAIFKQGCVVPNWVDAFLVHCSPFYALALSCSGWSLFMWVTEIFMTFLELQPAI